MSFALALRRSGWSSILAKARWNTTSADLTVTDPLNIYRSLVARGRLSPDPSQHRTAIVLQSVYDRLLDYEPPEDVTHRLKAVTNALKVLEDQDKPTTPKSSSWRDYNFLPNALQSSKMQSTSLVRTMTDEDAVLEMDTPRGLILCGEVGGGKSLLMDILASSLPSPRKERHHFNAFMLRLYAELEKHRRNTALHDTFSLLHVAREIVATSNILFLDEFQFPDRATSVIMRHFLISFFRLGGILIATSNRMPKDLFNDWMKGEMSVFQDILEKRCEVWDMRSTIDWRRHGVVDKVVVHRNVNNENKTDREIVVPQNYYLQDINTEDEWQAIVEDVSQGHEQNWRSSSMNVYSRVVPVPAFRNSCAKFTFHELCSDDKRLGPADYLSLTSAYSTIIIDAVPVLTARYHRHEARRFITLLDAIYESRCKILLRAHAPIEELFFPDTEEGLAQEKLSSDAIHSEAFAESYQDLTAPFRPNISAYRDVDDTILDRKMTEDHDFRDDKVDFTALGKYHGEDERFAFKRAISRLWEVCGSRWWSQQANETRSQFHTPLPADTRTWEISQASQPGSGHMSKHVSNIPIHSEAMGSRTDIDESPNLSEYLKARGDKKEDSNIPPKFPPQHVWGMVKWGKRAGRWGQGVDAYKDADKELIEKEHSK